MRDARTKFEIIEVDRSEIMVDISLLKKSDEMFFNATQMGKVFDKKPVYFLRLDSTKEYMKEIFKDDLNNLKNEIDLVKIKKGKYGGTWLHNELVFEFAGWLSPMFRRKMHKWVETRLKQEELWRQKRLEARTDYLPLTNAVMDAHKNPKFYHYSNEADLTNRIVLGMTAKKYKHLNDVDNVRDACTVVEIQRIEEIQKLNTSLIKLDVDFQERKKTLTGYYDRIENGTKNIVCD